MTSLTTFRMDMYLGKGKQISVQMDGTATKINDPDVLQWNNTRSVHTGNFVKQHFHRNVIRDACGGGEKSLCLRLEERRHNQHAHT